MLSVEIYYKLPKNYFTKNCPAALQQMLSFSWNTPTVKKLAEQNLAKWIFTCGRQFILFIEVL